MTACSVVGLGKLGVSLAAAIAASGVEVVGVDVDERTVELVNDGRPPIAEPGLDRLLGAHTNGRLRATASHEEAVLASDLTLVVVPTPSDERGAFSLRYAAEAFAAIGGALAVKDSYHLVCLTSTVLPGATRLGLLPVLERASGKTPGRDFGLCYSPEFVALGSVIHDFLHPDLLLVGEFDGRSGDTLEAFYRRVIMNDAPCARISLENAELAKIALNAYVTTKIAFANLLSELCERVPGGDVDAVTGAIGLDSRIGRRYLTGGLGFGGPCFPRDTIALSFFARAVGAESAVVEATDVANRAIVDRVVARILELVAPGSRVGVLGLAYKPGTPVLEGSQALEISQCLTRAGLQVVGYDPLVTKSALNGEVETASSLVACLEGVDAIVVATPDPVFRKLRTDDFVGDGRLVTIVDCWRILGEEIMTHPLIRYVALGCAGPDVEEANIAALWADEEAKGTPGREQVFTVQPR